MRLLHAAEVHSCTFKDKHSVYRYTVGRFRTYDGSMVSAFMRPRFNATRYQIINIPKRFKPSAELMNFISSILQIEELLPIITPRGFYEGSDFYTMKGAILDAQGFMPGQQIAEVTINETDYAMVLFAVDDTSEISFAQFAGCDPGGNKLWRIIPTPMVVVNDSHTLDAVIGLALECGGDLAIAKTAFH